MSAPGRGSTYYHHVLFEPGLLRTFPSFFPESIAILSDKYQVRPLRSDDYARMHCKLLSELTTVGDVKQEEWLAQYVKIQQAGCYYIVVIEDRKTHQLVASGTLLLERKFIHHCGTLGHIEDIVVAKEYRSLQLGIIIMEALKHIAIQTGCYKLVLDCAEKVESFYRRCGFTTKERQMVIYFEESHPSSASSSSSFPIRANL